MSASFSPTRIGQIALSAGDLDRATAFYRDVLGLKFLFSAPPGMSFFQCGDVRLLIGGPEAGGKDGATTLFYFVPDIQDATRVLTERGVAFSRDPVMITKLADREVWLAEFKDSEGNTAALMSEVPLAT